MSSDDDNRARGWSPVTHDRLPEILVAVTEWRTALAQSKPASAWRASQRFMKLTMCLQGGRYSPEDNLPLGRPQLEEALFHLFQVAHSGGHTDRSQREALDDVLRCANAPTIVATALVTDSPALTPRDEEALKFIKAKRGKGVIAKKIVAHLDSKKYLTSRATFYRHVAPKLKQHGVDNARARGGYYFDSNLTRT